MRLVCLTRLAALAAITAGCGGATTSPRSVPEDGRVPAPRRGPGADASAGSSATAAPAEAAPPSAAAAEAATASAPLEGARPEATWPERARFDETAAGLAHPWTLVGVRADALSGGAEHLALAQREEDGSWTLVRLLGVGEASLPGCASLPCPWPQALEPTEPLEEPAVLPEHVLTAVTYARTLLSFEGPLSVREGQDGGAGEAPFPDGLPDELWSASPDGQEPDLAPYLERLRRYHPRGYCSMDTRPQQAAMLRARAAAQAGRTGWAVQGWLETVGYWSSPRMAWSSYGQDHPTDHLELLHRVGVAPDRLLLGLLIDLPDLRPALHLADVRRVVPDLGPAFAADLRALAASSAIDPLNRALLFAAVAELPFAADPLYRQLPPPSRALLDLWSR